MNLINKKLLQLKIATHEFPDAEKMANAIKLLDGWQKALKDSDLEKTKEKSVQGKFLSTFFEAILGYSDVTTGNEEWTLIQHPRIENDSKEPDGSLGWFTKDKKITRAVIELKDAKTGLDKKQNRGSEKLTPIEQAYLYATKYDGCNWIIVSNFREIRLYNKHKTQEYYEKFDVVDLIQENEFKRFYFLLSKDTLLTKDTESIIDILAKDTLEAEQDITKKFYAEYKQVRLNLFQHLIDNNESIEKEVLLEKAQKLLDRFIFTLFCEDTSSLLPLNIVKTTYERALNSLSPSDERVWTEFRGLFIAIDKGNSRVTPPINAYNGGLFAFDEILDRLSVKDDFWTQIMRLSEYDFETDLNVNILGHIFEQSISDLESLKSELRGEEQDKKKSKRKKDGIYYTPEYITRYIVENTIGKYLEENPDKLSTIKILDPACGSGAFLNQAHSFLSNEYKVRHEALIAEKQSKGEAQTLFDYNPAENNRAILLNNLYGVDLNQESVEITKLALWLKTARKTEPLQNLDKNIKCGNSLIDDPEVAGEKAFNWNDEYKEIMDEGGFDVVIGNPPWGAELNEVDKSFLSNNYDYLEYQFETYVAFIEAGIKLLKQGGLIGFIIPSTWLSMHYFRKIREFLLDNELICIELIKYQAFEEVTAETSILICKKYDKKQSYTIKTRVLNTPEQFNLHNYTSFDSKTWKDNSERGFNLEYNPTEQKLINKIVNESNTLDRVAKPMVGIKPYQKGKGKPPQDQNSVQSRIFDAKSRLDNTYRKYIVGGDIERFYIHADEEKYISYGDWLAEPRKSLDFNQDKIVVRQTSDKIISAVDHCSLLNLNNVYNITIIDNAISLEALSLILNSRLLEYVYRYFVPEKGRVFPEIKSVNLLKLPIIIPSQETNLELVTLYKKIEQLIKNKYELQNSSVQFLAGEIGVDMSNFKRLDFTKLGWNELLELLEKKKISVSLEKREELFNWFKKRKDEINSLESEISLEIKLANTRVYDLYGLSQEEIAVIEKTNG